MKMGIDSQVFCYCHPGSEEDLGKLRNAAARYSSCMRHPSTYQGKMALCWALLVSSKNMLDRLSKRLVDMKPS